MMNPIARWRTYMGPKDERLEAESNQCVKVGYIILLVGSLISLYYGAMVGQVAYATDHALITPLGEAVIGTHSVLWVVTMLSILTVCIMQMHKGIFITYSRFAQVDRVPWDLVVLGSLAAGLAIGAITALTRILAEIQIVGIEQVAWAGDFAIGAVYFVLVFVVCLLAVAIGFHSAIKRRRKLESDLED